MAGDLCNICPGHVRLARPPGNIHHRSGQKLYQTIHGLGVPTTEVPHLAALFGLGGPQEGRGHVAGVDEVTALAPVSDHRERPSLHFLLEEDAEHRPIGALRADPGTIRIEDADGVDRQAVDPAPVEHGSFTQILRQGVRILRADWMVLARGNVGQTVAGRRGGIDELLDPGLPRALQDPHRPLDVRLHVLRGALDGRNDVADSGEVKHVANAHEERRPGVEPTDVPPLEREIRISGMVSQVALAAADEAVDHADAVAPGEEEIDHVAADEPGASGDDRDRLPGHAALTTFILRTLKYRSSARLSGSFPSLKARQRSRTASSTVRFGV